MRMKIEEIEIPAPWGRIAVKIWGIQDDEIIILVHGLLDNAGSFDNLIRLLPTNFCYICLDLPGHGLSSHLHSSIPIHTVDYTLALRIVFDYFQREKFILIGHSLGGQVSIFFTMLYPERVSKLVTIDALSFQPFYPQRFIDKLIEHHDVILGTIPKKTGTSRLLTYDDCITKLMEARSHEFFHRQAAEPLAKRMTKQTIDGGYVFTFDKKLRMFLSPSASVANIIDMYEKVPIKCPFMIILNTEFTFSILFAKVYKYLKKEGVSINIVDGHHDTHNTDPEKIAVKAWGEESSNIVIVTHGFQDNAGSFDRLIPLLPKHFYYVCVDLPGHGFSSNFHESMPIHYVNFLLAYQIVAQHFQRPSYILLGHSFGGQLSILFAQLYPERVSKLIVIDTVYTMPVDPSMFVEIVRNAHSIYFKLLEANAGGRPTYSYEEIVNKIKDNRYAGLLTYETAEDLARRMIKQTDDGKYILTVDSRLKGVIFPSADINYNIEMFKMKPVNCPVLMLLMPDNMYTNLNIKLLEYFKEIGFCIKHVNDHHHVHHTNPEVVADDISKFLISKQNKL